MTIGTVVLLPAAHLPANPEFDEIAPTTFDRRIVAADLLAHGVNVLVMPDAPIVEADDYRTATAQWVAHNAITLTAAQPAKPLMLVAAGNAGQLLAALGFSQKASRRPVASYVVVDGSIPKPGATDWPDAPVTYLIHGSDPSNEHARQAELRGWTVEKSEDVAASIRTILADS